MTHKQGDLFAVRSIRRATGKILSTTALTAAGIALFASPSKADNWGDHTYDQGNVNVDVSIPDTTNLTQTTDFVKARGDGDITAGHTVNIFQPGSSSKYVLYDTENDPTYIRGTLNANGQVYIFDRDGTIFSGTSNVNVGSIVVTTGHIADADLQDGDGRMTVQNVGSTGQILLEGTITVADAGLAAFVAPTVKNSGVINAKMGKVAMAAAERVTLDLYGDKLVEIAVDDKTNEALLENSGIINAQGGVVEMTARAARAVSDNVINMSGVINASSATVKGGKIILGGGSAGDVTVTGELNASGKDGGSIDVTGQNVYVGESAVFNVDGGMGSDGTGHGGIVHTIALQHADFRGRISGRGGVNGGNGGFAEVSGREALGFSGLADLYAENGNLGTLLLDPAFAVIHSGLVNNPLGFNYIIASWALANSLASANVTVQADNFIDVGTQFGAYNTGNALLDAALNTLVGAGPIDVSHWNFLWFSGETNGNLTLDSNVVNFNKDLTLGNGNLFVDANTINLNSRIYGLDATDVAVLLNDTRISSNSSDVNVISNKALIQQGVDLVATGGHVDVGGGTYEEQVEIKKNLTLNGNNAGDSPIDGVANAATIIKAPAVLGKSYNTYGTDNRSVVLVHDAGNVVIDGVVVDGANQGNANYRLSGIGYFNAGGEIKNSEIKNVGNNPFNGVQQGEGIRVSNIDGTARTVNITDNYIHDFQKNGITFNEAGLSGTISGNKIVGLGAVNFIAQNGIQIGYDANANVVRNNISGIGYTPSAWSASSILVIDAGDNVVVDDNTIAGTGVDIGVAVISTDNADIKNNKINGSGIGVLVDGADYEPYVSWGIVGGSDNNKVNNNTITNSSNNAVYVYHATNSEVNNNLINATGEDAIYVEGSASIDVIGNYIGYNNKVDNTAVTQNIHGDGIFVVGSNGAKIQGNKITQTTFTTPDSNGSDGNGIQVIGTDGVTIGGTSAAEGNSITNTTNGDGIRLQNNANVIAGYNVIDNTGRVGIWGSNVAGANINNNKISNDHLAGYGSIHADGGSNWIVQTNDIDGGDYGIRLNGVGGVFNSVDNNDVDFVTQDAVYVNNTSGLVIVNNDIGKYGGSIGGNGIVVDSSNGAYLSQNEVYGAGLNGISLSNTGSATVQNSTVDGSKLDGIKIVGGDTILVGGPSTGYKNTVTNSGVNGIEISGASNVTVKSNTVTGNKDSSGTRVSSDYQSGIGILLKNVTGTVDVSKNTSGNNVDGIRIQDMDPAVLGSVTVEANTTNNNQDKGIILKRSDNIKVYNNTVNGNAIGIYADASAGALIQANDINGSTADGIRLRDGSSNANIRNNWIHGSGGAGVYVDNSMANVSGVTLYDNSFAEANGSEANAKNLVNTSANIVNASFNWWGTNIESAVVAKITGPADISPYQGLGVDQQPATPGYQGSTANLYVTDEGAQTSGLIQEAIDIAREDGHVHVNAGTYTENLIIDFAGLKLEGLPGATLRYDNTRAGRAGNTYNLITVTADDVNIDPFVFDGSGVANNGIDADGADGLIVDGNTFQNFLQKNISVKNSSGVRIFGNTMTGGQTGVYGYKTPDIWIYDNTITGATFFGIQVTDTNGTDYFDDIDIWYNRINSAAGATGILVSSSNFATIGAHLTNQPNLDDSLNGNTITGGSHGIIVNNSSNAMVRHNAVTGTSNEGIEVNAGLGVKVLDNTLSTIGWDGIQVNGSINVEVGNNIVNNTVHDGIAVYSSAGANINKNKVGKLGALNSIGSGVGGGDAIFLTNSDNAFIQSNETANTHYNGPLRKGSGILVTNSDGVTIGGAGVLGNDVALAGSDGIVVRTDGGTANANKILNNTIHGLAGSRTGIYTEFATNTEIKDNTINGTGRYAAIYGYGGSGFDISGNILNHNDEVGIRLQSVGGTNKIDNNTIDNTGENRKSDGDGTNSGDAIQVISSSGVTVSNNKIGQSGTLDNIKGDGIFVNDSDGTKILGNKITQTHSIASDKGSGIQVLNSDNVVIGGANNTTERNVITNAGWDGIRVDNEGGTLSNVTIENNDINTVERVGIYAEGITNNSKIKNNLIKNPTLYGGIYTQGGSNFSITGNDIEHSKETGILVKNGGGLILVDGNFIDWTGELLSGAGENSGDGIRIVNTPGSPDGADIDANPDTGVTVSNNKIGQGAGAGTIKGNGVSIIDSPWSVVDTNNISNTTGNGIFLNPSANSVVKGNIIKTIGQNGIYLSANNHNVKVLSNKLDGVTLDGIYATGSNDIEIVANEIKAIGSTVAGALGHGINVNGGVSALIEDNIIQGGNGTSSGVGKKGVGGDGIHVDNNDGVEIVDNTIKGGNGFSSLGGSNNGGSGAGGHGIYVTGSSGASIRENDVLLGTNSLTRTGGKGADLGGIYAVNNAGISAYKNGIYIGYNVIDNGNLVQTATAVNDDGIYVENSGHHTTGNKATIEENTVSNVGEDGIDVRSTNGAQIKKNKIDSAVEMGIQVQDSNDVLVQLNTIGKGTALNSGAGIDGINVLGGRKVTIDQNTVQGGAGSAGAGRDGIHVINNREAVITNNTIKANGALSAGAIHDGIHVDNSGAQVGTTFPDNVVGQLRDGVVVTGNKILSSGVALGAGHDGIFVNNSAGGLLATPPATVASNTITGVGRDGVHVENTAGVQVLTNTITGAGQDGIFVGTSDAANIDDNDVTGALRHGIFVDQSDLARVTRNAITGVGANGIQFLSGDLFLIDDNDVTGAANKGILADGVNVGAITNNNVIGVGGDGIHLNNASLVSIADNNVIGGNSYGILLTDVTTSAVSRNLVSGIASNGIYLNNSNLIDVDHNTVAGIGGQGIYALGGNGIFILNNDVAGIAGDGIREDGVLVSVIDGNTVTATGGNGVTVLNSSLIGITNNLVSLTGGHGIFVDPSFFIDIGGNTLALTTLDGIHVDDVIGLNVHDNTVLLAGQDGIDITTSAGVLVTNNDVIGALGGDGIKLTNTLGDLVVGNNVIGALDNGIELNNSAFAGIVGNFTTLTGADGIHADGILGGLFAGNLVTLAGGDGIDINNGLGIAVVGNTVLGVAGNGIALNNTLGDVIAGNVVAGVGGNGIQLTNSALAGIWGNFTTLTAGDGIFVDGAVLADIGYNIVTLAGDDGIDIQNAAGVRVHDNVVLGTIGNGIEASNLLLASIDNNFVAGTIGNGIDLRNSALVSIDSNAVIGTIGDGIHAEQALGLNIGNNLVVGTIGDGISVADSALLAVHDNAVIGTIGNGIALNNVALAAVTNNFTALTLGNGIYANGVLGGLFAGNLVTLAGNDGIGIENALGVAVVGNAVLGVANDGIHLNNTLGSVIAGNLVVGAGDDGIQVKDSAGSLIAGNFVALVGDDGIDLDNTDYAAVLLNAVVGAGDNGIEISDSQYVGVLLNAVVGSGNAGISADNSSDLLIAANLSAFNKNGIFVDGVDDTNILYNLVANNSENGFYAGGGANQQITLAGNVFLNNTTGARFESGIIDLTGASNYIIGGTTGMLFDGTYGLGALQLVATPADIPGTSGTFGTTVFAGQSGDYITLTNNAFSLGFGSPIKLDVSYSTFDGFSPNSKPRDPATGIPVLTQAEYDMLENKFTHFNDSGFLGQLLFGYVPNNIAQEDLFKYFEFANLDSSGLNITVLGFPTIPGGPAALNSLQTFAGNSTNPADLNNIQTAAGGDDNASPYNLNAIETAAGGTQQAACWGDAMNVAVTGQAVSYSYSGGAEETLSAAGSCSSAF